MSKCVIKVAACCLLGSLIVGGNTLKADASLLAAKLPVAGITVALNECYSANPSADVVIKEYLAPTVKSEYADIAIAQVDNYINVRETADTASRVMGKLYDNSAATILEVSGDWYRISSGSVVGFVKAEYVVTGDAAAELAKVVGTRIAKVNTTTLKVRDQASTDATVQTLVPIDEEFTAIEELEGWVKIAVDADVEGYVSSEYVDLRTEFVQAESAEEEQARLAAEEAQRQAAAEAARQADEAAAAKRAASASKPATTTKSTTTSTSKASTPSVAASGTRQGIVSYALQFVGNPYVYGGTSLTRGTDCSGFTQSVYRDCGISIPRDSRSQAAAGNEISVSAVQPGDLLFYSNGSTINHVALYIGNGQVVHASNPSSGIKISNMSYRTPCKAVSYIN